MIHDIVENTMTRKERQLAAFKDDVHHMTNQLQTVLGFMELGDYDKALIALHQHILHIRELATHVAGTPEAVTMLSGLADLDKTVRIVPKHTVVEVTSGASPKTMIVTQPGTDMRVIVQPRIAAHKTNKNIKKPATSAVVGKRKKPPHPAL